MIKHIFTGFIILLCIAGCIFDSDSDDKKDDETPAVTEYPYFFPLRVGNKFMFDATSVETKTGAGTGIPVEVIDSVLVNDTVYYKVYQEVNALLPDTLLLREVDHDIRIFTDAGEKPYLNFSAKNGSSWTIPNLVQVGENEYKSPITVTRLDQEILASMYTTSTDTYRLFKFSVNDSTYWFEIYRRNNGMTYSFNRLKTTGWVMNVLTYRMGVAIDYSYQDLWERFSPFISQYLHGEI